MSGIDRAVPDLTYQAAAAENYRIRIGDGAWQALSVPDAAPTTDPKAVPAWVIRGPSTSIRPWEPDGYPRRISRHFAGVSGIERAEMCGIHEFSCNRDGKPHFAVQETVPSVDVTDTRSVGTVGWTPLVLSGKAITLLLRSEGASLAGCSAHACLQELNADRHGRADQTKDLF